MHVIASPVGPLGVDQSGGAITQILFHAREPITRSRPDAVIAAAIRQLGEYFNGDRQEFDLPLAPSGTSFQREVWDALIKIPYGQTVSYAQLAGRIGRPAAVRAVGAANGQNPIPIVIPCHRVIGSNGSLVGFGGGLEMKKFLLRLEARQGDLLAGR